MVTHILVPPEMLLLSRDRFWPPYIRSDHTYSGERRRLQARDGQHMLPDLVRKTTLIAGQVPATIPRGRSHILWESQKAAYYGTGFNHCTSRSPSTHIHKSQAQHIQSPKTTTHRHSTRDQYIQSPRTSTHKHKTRTQHIRSSRISTHRSKTRAQCHQSS